MHNHSRTALLSAIIFSLLLGACSLPARNLPNLETRIDLPYNGSLFSLSPILVDAIGHALDDVGPTGVTRFQFFANGRDIGSAAAPSVEGSGVGGSIHWTPPAAGEYILQVEAQTSHGSAISPAVRICVLDISFSELIDRHSLGYGFDGPCEIPPAGTGTGTVGMTARAIPEGGLAYNDELRPNPDDENNPIKIDNTCVPAITSPTLNFEARVTDPGDQVAFVNVEVLEAGGGAPTGPWFGPVALSHTADSVSYEKIFTGGGLLFLDSDLSLEFLGNIGTLEWTARAFSRTGAVLVTDGPHSVFASPCVAVESSTMPLVVAPTDTPTATLEPYVAPTKERVNCAQYTTDTACKADPACKYDYVGKRCVRK